MSTIRDTATVTVSVAVDGTVRRRRTRKGARSSRVYAVTVNRAVWLAAMTAVRPGERIVIVSESEVRLTA